MINVDWLAADMARVEGLLTSVAGASSHPLVSEPCLHLIRAGGKRLRPALVLLSSHAGEPRRPTTDLAAAAIELVHLATLYHDDVIDETETRRGVATAHSKWGTEVAVLAGDYLFACGSSLGARAGGEVPGILASAIAAVCEGEIVEISALNDPRRSIAHYTQTIRGKTAALFGAACDLGAATSGVKDAERAALASYGVNLGLAFQVVDDLLDFVGDPGLTGKEPGTDLKEGVFTAPVLLACEREPALAARLAAGERELDALLGVLESTGALADTVALASGYGQAALDELAVLPDGPYKEALAGTLTAVLDQVPAVPAR